MESNTRRDFEDVLTIRPRMKLERPALFHLCAEAVDALIPGMAAPLPPKFFPVVDLEYRRDPIRLCDRYV
jgi:hypothetical protein